MPSTLVLKAVEVAAPKVVLPEKELRPVQELLSINRVEDAEEPPVERQTPSTAKQPSVMLMPLFPVVVPVVVRPLS